VLARIGVDAARGGARSDPCIVRVGADAAARAGPPVCPSSSRRDRPTLALASAAASAPTSAAARLRPPSARSVVGARACSAARACASQPSARASPDAAALGGLSTSDDALVSFSPRTSSAASSAGSAADASFAPVDAAGIAARGLALVGEVGMLSGSLVSLLVLAS
jgi:hypothetical protein